MDVVVKLPYGSKLKSEEVHDKTVEALSPFSRKPQVRVASTRSKILSIEIVESSLSLNDRRIATNRAYQALCG